MAANQRRAPFTMGFAPTTPGNVTSTLALSSNGIYLALGSRLDQAKTLSKVQIYCSAVANAGSIGVNDLTCDVYSSAAGQPNASLQSVNTLTSTIAVGWVEFTGFTLSLSAGVQYWLVLKNANGTAGTNYPTYQYGGSGTVPFAANGGGSHVGWAKWTYSSGAWGSGLNTVSGYRLQFSDGTYDGFPVQSISTGSDKIYSTNEVGVAFTMPAGAKFNVRGATMFCNISGTPTGTLSFKLYQNGTLAATSNGIVNSDVALSGATYYTDYFSADVTLNPGDAVMLTAKNGNTDSSGNAFIMGDEYKFASDANTLALLPIDGTLQKVTIASGTPTTTNTSIFPFSLLLDSAGEFTSAGGGGGIIYG